MSHLCHAYGCSAEVAPSLFMCRRHWLMVPRALQNAIWRTYRQGQETTKDPTPEYLDAAKAAKDAVANRESGSAIGGLVEVEGRPRCPDCNMILRTAVGGFPTAACGCRYPSAWKRMDGFWRKYNPESKAFDGEVSRSA